MKVNTRREILGQLGTYMGASQLTHVFTAIAGILTRNFLGPLQMGIWSTLLIVLEYAKYSTLGTTKATTREIPYHLGKGEEGEAEQIKNCVASFGSLTSLIVAVGIVIFTFVFQAKIPPILFWGLLVTAGLVVLQRLNNLLIGLLRAYKRFEIASTQMILSAVLNLVLILCLAYPFKIYGFLAATALSLIFNIVYISWKAKFHFEFKLGSSVLNLISFGVPLMILGVLATILKSVDKIVIINYLGFEAMGFYSVAILATNFLGQIPNAMGIVMIPHLQERYSIRDSVEDVRGYIDKAADAFSLLMPVLIGFSWLAAPLMVRWILPQYVSGVEALQFLILSTFFVALALPYGNLIITLKKHLFMFPITGCVIFLSIILNVIVVQLGYGIKGVALATTLSLSINFLLLFLVASRQLYNFQEGCGRLGSLLVKFLFMTGVLYFIHTFVSHPNLPIQVLLQLFVYLIVSFPLLYQVIKKYELLTVLKENILRRDTRV